MLEISEMVKRVQRSERSQMKMVPPKGAIRMDIGDPDFETPIHIQEAASRAMRENFTHYTDPQGDIELREAICFGFKRDHKIIRNPSEILVTAGALEAIHVISATYINPGDEVLLMDPEYSAYADAIILFGGRPVFVPTTQSLRLDFKAIRERITHRTKMIYLSNPCNPTARVLREDEVISLARIAKEHDLLLVLDEVYCHLTYDGREHFSICQVNEVRDRTILVNSFSKTYAMTGWRVGYILADSNMIQDLVSYHRALIGCVNTPAQKSCVAALLGPQDCVLKMKVEYDKRKQFVEKKLAGIERLSASLCEGAFYFFPRFDHSLTSRELTSYLFERGLMVRSGTEFGENGERHIRLSFTASIERLEEGLEKLKRALDELD